MLISEFDFALPAELIAQTPLAERERSRMLVVHRGENAWQDNQFANFPEFLRAGDVVVFNNTRVFPARLVGRRAEFAGRIELFLIRELLPLEWEALARPARRLSVGTTLLFGDENQLRATVTEKRKDGRVIVRFDVESDFFELLEAVGQTPLPPYIARDKSDLGMDRERYQTVFARERGAIAAPTAGLHFTTETLREIERIGAQRVEITLHVGYGTFEPVRVENLAEHRVASEFYTIESEAAAAITAAKKNGARIVAIGTTTTRALESATGENGEIISGAGTADLTVLPGYRFRTVNALLTNFHLPRSSLLVLVSTFAGHDLIMSAYAHAINQQYRFYSYGDCVLIV